MDLDYFHNVRNNVSLIINRHFLITLFAWRSCAATVAVYLVPLPYPHFELFFPPAITGTENHHFQRFRGWFITIFPLSF